MVPKPTTTRVNSIFPLLRDPKRLSWSLLHGSMETTLSEAPHSTPNHTPSRKLYLLSPSSPREAGTCLLGLEASPTFCGGMGCPVTTAFSPDFKCLATLCPGSAPGWRLLVKKTGSGQTGRPLLLEYLLSSTYKNTQELDDFEVSDTPSD